MERQGRPIDLPFTPLELLGRWPTGSRAVLLHSGRHDPRWARRSILGAAAGFYRFTADPQGRGRGQWIGPADACPFQASPGDRPFRDLRMLSASAGDGLWVGTLSYDLGRWVESLPTRAVDDRGGPVIEMAWCPGYLVHDGATGRWTACGAWRDALPFDLTQARPQSSPCKADELVSTFDRAGYEAMVRKALGYIAAGDIFQVNLSQRFTARLRGEHPIAHRTLFARLATRSPAWYGAYLESDRVIASTSPELFLEVTPDGHVTTRPIKGTRPATVDAMELERSEKDTAELNMIVDLLRNDLGRVCSYGSVQVTQPRTIESHPTVHHGVATITGRLHPSRDMIDLLRAAMPGGSVTGAPKVRAMQIIDELEPVRRGPYCGCIGWLSREAMCMNVAIRTLVIDPAAERVDFSVGGGIVADSAPAAEYDETLAKAKAMMDALGLVAAT